MCWDWRYRVCIYVWICMIPEIQMYWISQNTHICSHCLMCWCQRYRARNDMWICKIPEIHLMYWISRETYIYSIMFWHLMLQHYTHLVVAIFPDRDCSAAWWWWNPRCIIPGNESAIRAARQHWASCSFLATVQLVRSPSRNTKFLKEHLVHVRGVPPECFMFREGDLTSWTVARKLQLAQCWRAAQIAASLPGTIQWGFYHREGAREWSSGKIGGMPR